MQIWRSWLFTVYYTGCISDTLYHEVKVAPYFEETDLKNYKPEYSRVFCKKFFGLFLMTMPNYRIVEYSRIKLWILLQSKSEKTFVQLVFFRRNNSKTSQRNYLKFLQNIPTLIQNECAKFENRRIFHNWVMIFRVKSEQFWSFVSMRHTNTCVSMGG